jgi:hypothetical protein
MITISIELHFTTLYMADLGTRAEPLGEGAQIVIIHGKKRRARCSTGLNNVLLPTLFTLVNNVEQYC